MATVDGEALVDVAVPETIFSVALVVVVEQAPADVPQSVAVAPETVIEASGKVTVRVVAVVIPEAENATCFVRSVWSTTRTFVVNCCVFSWNGTQVLETQLNFTPLGT